MSKLIVITALFSAALLAGGCGDNGNGSEDTTTEDLTVPDQQDLTDPVPDPTTDPVTDPTTDPVTDPVPDPETDPTTDEMDTGPDGIDPDGTDVDPDAPIRCESMEGYCIEYSLSGDSCVTCTDSGDIHYKPAGGLDGSYGCTAEGEGVGAWCCIPQDTSDPTTCEESDGECYTRSGSEDPCPLGWVEDADTACVGSRACCMPGDTC